MRLAKRFVAGQINTRFRIIRPVAWVGYGLSAIGFGLFYKYYRYPFSESLQLGLEAIVGVGIGLSLAVPIIVLQAAMPLKEMAAATSAWSLSRSLGGSIGGFTEMCRPKIGLMRGRTGRFHCRAQLGSAYQV